MLGLQSHSQLALVVMGPGLRRDDDRYHLDQNPFASSAMPCAPALRSFEISRYSGEFAQAWNAASSGNDIRTSLSRSQTPSSTAGVSSADSSRPLNFLNTSKNRA